MAEPVERRSRTDRRESQWEQCPRFYNACLTQEQIEDIVDRAAEKAAEKALEMGKNEIISSVGTFVITKIGYAVGLVVLGLLAILSKYDLIAWK